VPSAASLLTSRSTRSGSVGAPFSPSRTYKDGLVLIALAAGMKIIRTAHLRSPDGANLQQLREPRVDLVAPGKRVKNGARVAQLPARRKARCRDRLDFPDSGKDRRFCGPGRYPQPAHFGLRRTGGTERALAESAATEESLAKTRATTPIKKNHQKSSQQTRTSQHKHLTSVVDETPRNRLAEQQRKGVSRDFKDDAGATGG
jgi:hypothetical protein